MEEDLKKTLAGLEEVNNQLRCELQYYDYLARLLGFSNGLESIKLSAASIVEGSENSPDQGSIDDLDEF